VTLPPVIAKLLTALLAPHLAGLHHAPACFFQGGIDQLGAGFGFVR
jgi:hypothetical protein